MFEPRPGMRVVVRYTAGGETTDALGEVAAADAQTVAVITKSGRVDIDRDTIVLAHEIPPAPTRSGSLHTVVSALDLRRIAAAVWMPPERAWLHKDNLAAELAGAEPTVQTGWLLRVAPELTGTSWTLAQTNCAAPLGDPEVEADAALELAQQWLTDRGVAPHVQIFSAAQTTELDPVCAPVAGILRANGYVPGLPVLALTAATSLAAGGAGVPAGLTIVHSEQAAGVHLSLWGHEPGSAIAGLIAGADNVRIISAVAQHADGSKTLVGVARMTIAMKWAVLSHLVVAPDLRRRGAGRALVQAAARLAAAQGIRSVLAEVPAENSAALGLAQALGFSEHHRVWYAHPADAA